MEGTLTSGKKWASGTIASSSSDAVSFTAGAGGSVNAYRYYDIALNFVPSYIFLFGNTSSIVYYSFYQTDGYYGKMVTIATAQSVFNKSNTQILLADDKVCLSNNIYRMPMITSVPNVKWIAYE